MAHDSPGLPLKFKKEIKRSQQELLKFLNLRYASSSQEIIFLAEGNDVGERYSPETKSHFNEDFISPLIQTTFFERSQLQGLENIFLNESGAPLIQALSSNTASMQSRVTAEASLLILSFFRSAFMAQAIADKIQASPNSQIVALMGLAHAFDGVLLTFLKEQGVSFQVVGEKQVLERNLRDQRSCYGNLCRNFSNQKEVFVRSGKKYIQDLVHSATLTTVSQSRHIQQIRDTVFQSVVRRSAGEFIGKADFCKRALELASAKIF